MKPQGDRLGPAGMPRASSLICQPNLEGVPQTVLGQEVLAAALEAEELAIKCAEVGIPEHRAGPSGLHASLTALARRQLQFLIRPTLDRRTAHLGAADGAAIAAAAPARTHVPGLVVLVSHTLDAALAPYLRDGAARAAAVLELLELG